MKKGSNGTGYLRSTLLTGNAKSAASLKNCSPSGLSASIHGRLLATDVEVRKLLFQMVDLWKVVNHDVGIFRMMNRIVLVIVLSAVERLQRFNLRHDPA